MRSFAAESATVALGVWPAAQKKCFGFVRSEVRDEADDAPSRAAVAARSASTAARRATD
jgi:hypothetical protein